MIQKYDAHESGVNTVEFDSSQFFFLSGGKDGKMKTWDIRKGLCI